MSLSCRSLTLVTMRSSKSSLILLSRLMNWRLSSLGITGTKICFGDIDIHPSECDSQHKLAQDIEPPKWYWRPQSIKISKYPLQFFDDAANRDRTPSLSQVWVLLSVRGVAIALVTGYDDQWHIRFGLGALACRLSAETRHWQSFGAWLKSPSHPTTRYRGTSHTNTIRVSDEVNIENLYVSNQHCARFAGLRSLLRIWKRSLFFGGGAHEAVSSF